MTDGMLSGEDDDLVEVELLPICRHCLVDIKKMTDRDGGVWWRHKATGWIYCTLDPSDDSRATPRVRMIRR